MWFYGAVYETIYSRVGVCQRRFRKIFHRGFPGDRGLTGQKHSTIVTPNGKTALFDEHGIIETGIVSNHISDERRKALMRLLGGDNE